MGGEEGETLYEKLLNFFAKRNIRPHSLVDPLLKFELVNKEVTATLNYMITDLIPETQYQLQEFASEEQSFINSEVLKEKLEECSKPEEMKDLLDKFKDSCDESRAVRENIDKLSWLDEKVKKILKLKSDAPAEENKGQWRNIFKK